MAAVTEQTTDTKDNFSTIFLVTPELSTESIEPLDCLAEGTTFSEVFSLCVILTGIILLCENILLISIIVRSSSLHTNTNTLVASLALTDVLVGVQCCVIGLASMPGGLRIWLGDVLSNLHLFDSFMATLNCSLLEVSLLHMALLALDRYLYVLWPFRYIQRVTRRRIYLASGAIWALGVGYITVATALLQTDPYREICVISQTPVAFTYWPLIGIYLLSLTVVCTCTLGMAKLALTHKRRQMERNPTRRKDKAWHRDTDKPAGVSCTVYRSNGSDTKGASFEYRDGKSHQGRDKTDTITTPIIATIQDLDVNTTNNNDLVFPTGKVDNDSSFKDGHRADGSVEKEINNDTPKATRDYESGDETTDPSKCLKKTNVTDPAAIDSEVNIELSAEVIASKSFSNTNKDTATGETQFPEAYLAKDSHRVWTSSRVADQGLPDRDVTNNLANSNGVFRKANLKIIKFVLVMFGTFVACTLPSIIIICIVRVMGVPLLSVDIVDILHFSLAFNSGMNFFIISYMNKDFRAALIQRVPCCKVCCTKRMVRKYTQDSFTNGH